MVIFTSSSKLASLPLKSVAFDASTVKIFWVPSPLENVSPLDSLVTSCGAGGGAFCCSRCAAHFRSRYTPTVRLASSIAAAADQRAYFAASLLFMSSVKQNFDGVYMKMECSFRRRRGLPGPLGIRSHIRQNPHIRRGDAVAFRILHQVHRLIGKVQQSLLGSRVHGVGCHAHAGRQPDVQPFRTQPDALADQFM